MKAALGCAAADQSESGTALGSLLVVVRSIEPDPLMVAGGSASGDPGRIKP